MEIFGMIVLILLCIAGLFGLISLIVWLTEFIPMVNNTNKDLTALFNHLHLGITSDERAITEIKKEKE